MALRTPVQTLAVCDNIRLNADSSRLRGKARRARALSLRVPLWLSLVNTGVLAILIALGLIPIASPFRKQS
jgi:hypothetical protein